MWVFHLFFIAFYFLNISPKALSGKTIYAYRRIKGKKNTARKTKIVTQTCIHHHIFHCFFPFYAFASLFWPQFVVSLLPHFYLLLCHLNRDFKCYIQESKEKNSPQTSVKASDLSPPQTPQKSILYQSDSMAYLNALVLFSSSKDSNFKQLIKKIQT